MHTKFSSFRRLSGLFLGSVVAVNTVSPGQCLAGNGREGKTGKSKECRQLPSVYQLKEYLQDAASGTGISSALGPSGSKVGGLFDGTRMWAAVVDRDGKICSFTTSTNDPKLVQPASQQIAKAKAFTANGFSVDILPVSTANLYTIAQPGQVLYGVQNSNPFNPRHLTPTDAYRQLGEDQIAGGIITWGGGVPLYNETGQVVGGLGISGDTACADHEIAKRVRELAGFNPPGGPLVDDIHYSEIDPPSLVAHPVCLNTVRNGNFVGSGLP